MISPRFHSTNEERKIRPRKLAFLDSYTFDPTGDISWAPLTDCDLEVVLHLRTAPKELCAHANGAELPITNKVRLSEEDLRSLPSLKYVGIIATGFDVVDVRAARALGITVTLLRRLTSRALLVLASMSYRRNRRMRINLS